MVNHDELIAMRRYSVRADLLSSDWWLKLEGEDLAVYEKIKALIDRFGKAFITLHLDEQFSPLAYDQSLNEAMLKKVVIIGRDAREKFLKSSLCLPGTKWISVARLGEKHIAYARL